MTLSRSWRLQWCAAVLAALCVNCTEQAGISNPDDSVSFRLQNGAILSAVSRSDSGSILSIPGEAAAAAEADTVYVSLSPGTLPSIRALTIQNLTLRSPAISVALVDGGFDPVPVAASEGDSLLLTPSSDEGSGDPVIIKVPAKKPPTIVRSNPPKGRTDVATNVLITVIFSKPVDRNTVTEKSIKVLRDGVPVEGTLLMHAEPWIADFVPTVPLQRNTTYSLIVTSDVADNDGEPLSPMFSAVFMTGERSCTDPRTNCQGLSIAGSYVVSGRVTQLLQSGVQPVAGAEISALVKMPDLTGYRIEGILTDDDGRYTIGSLPEGEIIIAASKQGLEQHCVAATPTHFYSTRDTDIQLTIPGDFRNAEPPSQISNGNYFNGHTYVWYGSTPYGPAISAARVSLEISDFVAVSALTDGNGYFAFCKTRQKDVALTVAKSGYEPIRWFMGELFGGEAFLGLTPLR
ncbi:MAG TPA: Ig-like domain-containing protein [Gemmatimonadaceae bacterium]|jgi:hypothetical protein|nr:Ig-like domain-containing protein [Gemmatimonadaceae bacterium]